MEALKPDFVVIGEATELNLDRGGQGRAGIPLETTGKPAHSSSPHLGVNAVHQMIKLIDAVERTPLGSHPLLGPALLALADMISDPYPGHSVNTSRCRVTYDRRMLPGETTESVLDAIRAQPGAQDIQFNAVIAQGEHHAYTGSVLLGPKFFPAWDSPRNIHSCRRQWAGCSRPASPRKSAPTASAPTPPTAPGSPVSPV